MKYRADIDGLRAVAIILVLIYHGGLSFFPSGFVGVDVFFVISGFLITTLIHTALNEAHFSLIDFYQRRLWRLQPVMICLLVISTILTLVFFLPDDLIAFSHSANQVSLFSANVFFKDISGGYFAPESNQLPLLHTWSLAVEWQCYLLFPLLIYGLHRLLNTKTFIITIYALTLVLIVLTFHNTKFDSQEVYFQWNTRLFEFLIGSCVAITSISHSWFKSYETNILALISFFLILFIARLPQVSDGSYPNRYALVICLATALLIVLGQLKSPPFVIRFLSYKPIAFIGLISYSLYIWHWLILSLMRYENFNFNTYNLVLAYSLILAIAYLSWRFIEKPARHFQSIKFRYTVALLVILPILITYAMYSLIESNHGFPKRFNSETVHIVEQLAQYNKTNRQLCINNPDVDVNRCTIGSKKADSKKGFLFGDSISNAYWGFMDVLGKDANVSILSLSTVACITLPSVYLYNFWKFKNQIYKPCSDQTERYYQMIQKNHYDFVILSENWYVYATEYLINHEGDERSKELGRERFKTALREAITLIITSGAKPVLIKEVAKTPEAYLNCFFKQIKSYQHYDRAACQFEFIFDMSDLWMDNFLNQIQKEYPTLIMIDPKLLQCEDNKCVMDINGVPFYKDPWHITDYASYQLGDLFLKKFGNPLRNIHPR